ncbi:MAG: OsmC family protein, partial [Halobacteriales archaeon]
MSNQRVREAVEETAVRLGENPELGRDPDTPATATFEKGVRMRVEGPNDWEVATDHGESVGGTETASNLGWFLRGSIAACDWTVVRVEVSKRGIELTRLEVTVESESDSRGSMGLGENVPAGLSEVRIHFRLGSDDATADELEALLEWTDAHS